MKTIKFSFELSEEDAAHFIDMLSSSIKDLEHRKVIETAEAFIAWYEGAIEYEKSILNRVLAGQEVKENE